MSSDRVVRVKTSGQVMYLLTANGMTKENPRLLVISMK